MQSTERQWQIVLTVRPATGNSVDISLQYGETHPDVILPHAFNAVLSTDMLKARIEEPMSNALMRVCNEITPVLRRLKAQEMIVKQQLQGD